MTIKTLIPCLSLAVVLLPGVSLSADDSFIPWNSDVKVADEITQPFAARHARPRDRYMEAPRRRDISSYAFSRW